MVMLIGRGQMVKIGMKKGYSLITLLGAGLVAFSYLINPIQREPQQVETDLENDAGNYHPTTHTLILEPEQTQTFEPFIVRDERGNAQRVNLGDFTLNLTIEDLARRVTENDERTVR